MQFDTSARSVLRSLLLSARDSKSRRPKLSDDLGLQLYREPPTEDITLLEFEELASKRLKVLKIIEHAHERYTNETEMNDHIGRELSTLMPIACGLCSSNDLNAERRRDIISHFILRLAFCQSIEQSKWFIQREVDLFKFRFKMASKNRVALTKFLEANQFDAVLVPSIEKQQMLDDLSNAGAIPVENVRNMDYWRVPFVDALDLLRKRCVLLRAGRVFVSENDLAVILSTRLRIIISSAMAQACKYMSFIEEEDRLIPLLRKLTNNAYSGKQYEGKDVTARITPDMVDDLSTRSFPLCMRHIHSRLRTDHHLRHGARLQYSLFLKAIGLSLNDALTFWRHEFTKKIDADKFDKQYAYNIRHNYGKEGRQHDYPAYPCTKIILGSNVSEIDCHGCPYRHFDSQSLSQKLRNIGLNNEQTNNIVALSKRSQYDLACTRYFEYTHNMAENSLESVITHPNQFFEISREIFSGTRNRNVEPKISIVSSTQDDSLMRSHSSADISQMDIEDLMSDHL